MDTSQLQFQKYQANGNDFILVDRWHPSTHQAVQLCDRHKGIGADGILSIDATLQPPRMTIYNSDGSKSTMCGNGTLCAMEYLKNRGLAEIGSQLTIEIEGKHLKGRLNKDGTIEVRLAKASFLPKDIPFLTASTEQVLLDQFIPFRGTANMLKLSPISINNPHCVVLLKSNPWLTESLEKLDLKSLAQIQRLPEFPESVNVQFVEIVNTKHVRCRVIERGVGETQACGSGACAVVAVCHKLGLIESKAKVEYKGGSLGVRVESDQSVYLISQAYKVFEGTVNIPSEKM